MAGGRGERMRAAGAALPKPLVTVDGASLLERNLAAVLGAGLRDIVVAVPSHTPSIAAYVRGRGTQIAETFAAKLTIFEEIEPLGNIGAAAAVATGGRELLVVYADNLTALDLNAFVEHHRREDAVLTVAVHREPFRIPFGEVRLANGLIDAYIEKPERRILVASGLFVLGPSAIARVPRARTEVSWLVNELLAAKARVAAFLHDAAWIDVNDMAAAERAERLLVANRDAFGQAVPARAMRAIVEAPS